MTAYVSEVTLSLSPLRLGTGPPHCFLVTALVSFLTQLEGDVCGSPVVCATPGC
jgi:hypothetical protein